MVGAHNPACGVPVRMHGDARVRPGERGFTLIELLVAIVIISVLFALLLPSVDSARKAPERPGLEVAASSMWRAVARYRADYRGAFPASAPLVSASAQASPQAANATLKTALRSPSGQPYLDSFPVMPGNSQKPIRIFTAKPASYKDPYLLYVSAGQVGRLEAWDSRGKRAWCRAVENIAVNRFQNGGAGQVAC